MQILYFVYAFKYENIFVCALKYENFSLYKQFTINWLVALVRVHSYVPRVSNCMCYSHMHPVIKIIFSL